MHSENKQELQIIKAFSSVDVPERILRESNINELVHSMVAGQDAVQSDAQRLELLRQEQKDGNFIGNWLNDRDEMVEDAQIDLNKSIGCLTQQSSQLLIVNTAISKILNDQQRILLEQQGVLQQQTITLEEQNRKIVAQQNQLALQQQEINAANQGLLEAKGLTREQAQQLVGCVTLVTEAESRINSALQDSVTQCITHLNDGFSAQQQRNDGFEQQMTATLSNYMAEQTAGFIKDVEQQLHSHTQRLHKQSAAQNAAIKTLHEDISERLTEFQHNVATQLTQKTLQLREAVQNIDNKQAQAQQAQDLELTEQRTLFEHKVQHLSADISNGNDAQQNNKKKLAALQILQQKNSSTQRLWLILVTCLSLASLGWQAAQHFAIL